MERRIEAPAATLAERPRSHRIALFCAWLLLVFLVLFPKGGIKIGPIPLTWGYLLLGLLAMPLLVFRLLGTRLRFTAINLAALATLVPFQLCFLYAGKYYGVANVGFTISTAINLFFLPAMFLFIIPGFLPYVDGAALSRYFRTCLLLTAIWGLILFVWHPLTGHYIEIPYLTVNADDYGQLERTKHIARGFFFKLISTYNNGNLYGTCVLLVLPLYLRLEPKLWKRNVVRLATFCTLSRTIWAGLVVNEVATVAVVLLDQISTFPRLYLQRVGKQMAAIVMSILTVLMVMALNSNTGLQFLLDPTAGGRAGMVSDAEHHLTLLPAHPLFGFEEVLYASALQYWGIVGLISFSLIMAGPLLVTVFDTAVFQSPLRRAALKGLLLYAFISFSDGGYNFIPTQAFYFFVYMIMIFGWPKPKPKYAAHREGLAPTLHVKSAEAM